MAKIVTLVLDNQLEDALYVDGRLVRTGLVEARHLPQFVGGEFAIREIDYDPEEWPERLEDLQLVGR